MRRTAFPVVHLFPVTVACDVGRNGVSRNVHDNNVRLDARQARPREGVRLHLGRRVRRRLVLRAFLRLR